MHHQLKPSRTFLEYLNLRDVQLEFLFVFLEFEDLKIYLEVIYLLILDSILLSCGRELFFFVVQRLRLRMCVLVLRFVLLPCVLFLFRLSV